MKKPYHKIIFAYVRGFFGYIGYFFERSSKGRRPRLKDYVDLNEVSEVQEKYYTKKVMDTALDSLRADGEENKRMEKLLTEQKRKNYKYKDDSVDMDFL